MDRIDFLFIMHSIQEHLHSPAGTTLPKSNFANLMAIKLQRRPSQPSAKFKHVRNSITEHGQVFKSYPVSLPVEPLYVAAKMSVLLVLNLAVLVLLVFARLSIQQ